MQTDPLSYYWPLSAFVTALMMNILTLLFERGNVKRQLALLACYINLLAASSDLINVNGWAYLGVDSLGFTFNLSRQIMWLYTTPLMVYLISIFSDVPPKKARKPRSLSLVARRHASVVCRSAL
jgi:bacteriorhodopsin